jgi:hypothetical protein
MLKTTRHGTMPGTAPTPPLPPAQASPRLALANLALSRKIQSVQLLRAADDLRRAAKRAGRKRVMQRGGCALAIAKPD